MKAKIYKTRHIHLDETPSMECLGNPQILRAEVIQMYRDRHDGWHEDERTGVITSLGDEDWQREGKTFIAVPVYESEAAIPYTEREDFDPARLAANYGMEIYPNWDAIPEAVRTDPMHLASLESLKREQNWKRVDIWNFIINPDVTNLSVSADGRISGYDHITETQYIFTPKD